MKEMLIVNCYKCILKLTYFRSPADCYLSSLRLYQSIRNPDIIYVFSFNIFFFNIITATSRCKFYCISHSAGSKEIGLFELIQILPYQLITRKQFSGRSFIIQHPEYFILHIIFEITEFAYILDLGEFNK